MTLTQHSLASYLRNIAYILLLILSSTTANAQLFDTDAPALLSEQEAFRVDAYTQEDKIYVFWEIAKDYYLYQQNFRITSDDPHVQVGKIHFPTAIIEEDATFGKVSVYFTAVELTAPISYTGKKEAKKATITVHAQGCNKPVGVCYPPMQRQLRIDLPIAQHADVDTLKPALTPEKAKPPQLLQAILLAFVGGLLLSLTPCVLPMVPIVAGIIGQQKNITQWRSGWLSICYVLGTMVTYILAGAVAGATGAQLQAYFQNIWMIIGVCLLLTVLSAALFGVFTIQLPNTWQNRLSTKNKSGAFNSFILGIISALIVGACVSPVLIAALASAITQGSALLGALTMGSMALGMGILLIAFGFGAGWLLPKTGAWMQSIQIFFGFGLLAVVLYLLASLGIFSTLALWSIWFFWFGSYLWQIPVQQKPVLNSLSKAIAMLCFVWGAMVTIGYLIDQEQQNTVLSPLHTLNTDSNKSTNNTLHFTKVTKTSEALALLEQAKQQQKPVFLDFYADWCLECKRIHRTTYRDQSIQKALQNWVLIEADVSSNNADSLALKKYFAVFGPPATLFFLRDGAEKTALRSYGYLTTTQLHAKIAQIP